MSRDDFHFDESANPLLNKISHDCVRILGRSNFQDAESSPLVATHLPYTCLPRSMLDSDDSGIIYLCREPKDTFVSMCHMVQRVTQESVPLQEEVDKSIEGKTVFGPYWDHISGYWRASVDSPHKVLFLKYEDLKTDTLFCVKKMADFMGKSFSEEEEKRGVAEEIVARCHIQNLSNLPVNKSGWCNTENAFKINNSLFYRKGEIGDRKNLLTENMTKID